MKVIDLLNKIAKGEITELHKFKWNERIWEEYSKFEKINNEKSYQEHKQNGTSFIRFENVCDARYFNDEIEIIIEEEKEIEEIKIWYEFDGKNNDEIIYHMCTELKDKINELVRELNKIKKEGK